MDLNLKGSKKKMFKLYKKEKIPTVPPFYTANPKYLLNIIFTLYNKSKYINVVYGALTYGWRGWTDGGLWLLNQLPNVSNRTETKFICTNVVITRNRMLDYYRRYAKLSSIPALRYRNIEFKMKHARKLIEGIIIADPFRAIVIPQVHMRILYRTIAKPITMWIHPFLNAYTVTQDDQIIAFGLGIPEYSYADCINRMEMNKRKAVLQIRRWWEIRISKHSNISELFPLFGWKRIRAGK